MSDDTRRPRRRPIAPILILLIVAGSLASLGMGISSLAIWTDTEQGTATFSAGTVDLTINPTTILTVTGIGPGQTGSGAVTVTNGGTLALRYALTSASTNADGLNLRDQLELAITAGACPGSGTLFAAAAIAGAGFGNPAQGAHTGDRSLAAGANETLCFAWSLPAGTANSFQGSATTTTFTFAAEQTVANP